MSEDDLYSRVMTEIKKGLAQARKEGVVCSGPYDLRITPIKVK